MRSYSLRHLDDATLSRDFTALMIDDRAAMAFLLAHIAEIDARRLYVPAGYTSMFAYCVEGFGMSEDEAYKRITAARAALRFPAIFGLLADGKLHLTAVRYLAPHLAPENAAELLASARGLTRSELEQMFSRRFDQPASAPASRSVVRPIMCAKPILSSQVMVPMELIPDSKGCEQLVPGPVEPECALPAPEEPIQRFILKVNIERSTYDKLRYLQSLLCHTVPSGDIAQVVDRAFDALIARVERRKFAAATKPRSPGRRGNPERARLVPAHVRRAVWARDEGRCTFIGDRGHRCRSRRFLEFDHVEPVARGGQATVDGMRLRCRTHNQYEAERVFGRAFMSAKREVSR
jgi:hypothetical protein